MKKINSFFKVSLLTLFCIYALSWGLDVLKNSNDGLIKNLYYHRIALRILIVLGFLYAVLFFTKVKSKTIALIAKNVLVGLTFLFILELGSLVYLKFIVVPTPNAPSHLLIYKNPRNAPEVNPNMFYGDLNTDFGRWRVPNKAIEVSRCSDSVQIEYKSNSIGARDKERTALGKNRIAFIGDSFVDGILINQQDRITELLEKETKIEHLNFGIIGANPIWYHLLYEKLVKPKFEHKAAVFMFFAGNDFDEFSDNTSPHFYHSPIYRAFWNKNNTISYTLPSPQLSTESPAQTYEGLMDLRDSMYYYLPTSKKLLLELNTNSYLWNAILIKGYQMAKQKKEKQFVGMYAKPLMEGEFGRQFDLSIKAIIGSNIDKPLVFLFLPELGDIKNMKSGMENVLMKKILKTYSAKNLLIIDLLPAFLDSKNRPEDYFIPCDGHLNEKGNKLIADYLLNNPQYQKILKP